jgi:type IV secretion system protein VirD4
MGWWERRQRRKLIRRGIWELGQTIVFWCLTVAVWAAVISFVPDQVARAAGDDRAGALTLAIATLASVIVIYLLWDRIGAFGLVKITGVGVPEAPGSSRMATKSDLKKAGLFDGDPRIHFRCGEAFGRTVYFTENSHVCISGETREGKGGRFIVENIRRLTRRSMVIMDPKGELAAITARFRRRVSPLLLIMDPFGEMLATHPHLKSCGFDPLILIDPKHKEFYSQCMAIAEAMVPIDSMDPHWTQRAQLLATALLMGAKWDEQAGKIPRATMRVFKKRLSQPYKESTEGTSLYETLVKMTKLEDEDAADLARTFLVKSEDPKEIEGVLASLQGKLKFLYDKALLDDMCNHPMMSNGKPFDFKLLKKHVATVYLILPVKKLETHALWLRLLVSNVVDSWSGLPGDVRPILFLDEAGALGNLQVLVRGLSILAGMGATIASFWQRHSQITKNYRDDAGAFKSSAGFMATLQCRDPETAHYFSQRADVGTFNIDSFSKAPGQDDKAKTTNTAPSAHAVIHPSQITGLPEGEAIGYVGRCPYPIRLKVDGYWDIDGPRLDPNPYYKPQKRYGAFSRSGRRAA